MASPQSHSKLPLADNPDPAATFSRTNKPIYDATGPCGDDSILLVSFPGPGSVEIRRVPVSGLSEARYCALACDRRGCIPVHQLEAFTAEPAQASSTDRAKVVLRASRPDERVGIGMLSVSMQVADFHERVSLGCLDSVAKLKGSWFWIEEICINHEDVEERKSQVGLLRTIYRHSEMTVVWLFPNTKYDISVDLQIFRKRRKPQPKTSDEPPDEISCLVRDCGDDADASRKEQAQTKLTTLGVEAYERLMRLPFFNRAESLVEVLLSPRPPVVLAGSHELDWAMILSTIQLLPFPGLSCLHEAAVHRDAAGKKFDPPADPVADQWILDTVSNDEKAKNLRNMQMFAAAAGDASLGQKSGSAKDPTSDNDDPGERPWDLQALLMLTACATMTLPYDRISSLAAMSQEAEPENGLTHLLIADQRCNLGDWCRQLTRYLIQKHQTLDIWSLIPAITPAGHVSESSWAIDFSDSSPARLTFGHLADTRASRLSPVPRNSRASLHEAARLGPLEHCLPVRLVPDDDDRVISLRGHQFDRVEKVIPISGSVIWYRLYQQVAQHLVDGQDPLVPADKKVSHFISVLHMSRDNRDPPAGIYRDHLPGFFYAVLCQEVPDGEQRESRYRARHMYGSGVYNWQPSGIQDGGVRFALQGINRCWSAWFRSGNKWSRDEEVPIIERARLDFLKNIPYAVGHALICTKSAVGRGPARCEPGDDICYLYGGATPFVLRRAAARSGEGGSEAETSVLVGGCYLASETWGKENEDDDKTFRIV